MPEYKQYVICPSGNNRILDHCFCIVKKAHKSASRSCYGDADHASIMCINDNNLILIVDRKNEFIVDFTKCKNSKASIIINCSTVEQVNIYKFLCLTMMHTLSWPQNN